MLPARKRKWVCKEGEWQRPQNVGGLLNATNSGAMYLHFSLAPLLPVCRLEHLLLRPSTVRGRYLLHRLGKVHDRHDDGGACDGSEEVRRSAVVTGAGEWG